MFCVLGSGNSRSQLPAGRAPACPSRSYQQVARRTRGSSSPPWPARDRRWRRLTDWLFPKNNLVWKKTLNSCPQSSTRHIEEKKAKEFTVKMTQHCRYDSGSKHCFELNVNFSIEIRCKQSLAAVKFIVRMRIFEGSNNKGLIKVLFSPFNSTCFFTTTQY